MGSNVKKKISAFQSQKHKAFVLFSEFALTQMSGVGVVVVVMVVGWRRGVTLSSAWDAADPFWGPSTKNLSTSLFGILFL